MFNLVNHALLQQIETSSVLYTDRQRREQVLDVRYDLKAFSKDFLSRQVEKLSYFPQDLTLGQTVWLINQYLRAENAIQIAIQKTEETLVRAQNFPGVQTRQRSDELVRAASAASNPPASPISSSTPVSPQGAIPPQLGDRNVSTESALSIPSSSAFSDIFDQPMPPAESGVISENIAIAQGPIEEAKEEEKDQSELISQVIQDNTYNQPIQNDAITRIRDERAARHAEEEKNPNFIDLTLGDVFDQLALANQEEIDQAELTRQLELARQASTRLEEQIALQQQQLQQEKDMEDQNNKAQQHLNSLIHFRDRDGERAPVSRAKFENMLEDYIQGRLHPSIRAERTSDGLRRNMTHAMMTSDRATQLVRQRNVPSYPLGPFQIPSPYRRELIQTLKSIKIGEMFKFNGEYYKNSAPNEIILNEVWFSEKTKYLGDNTLYKHVKSYYDIRYAEDLTNKTDAKVTRGNTLNHIWPGILSPNAPINLKVYVTDNRHNALPNLKNKPIRIKKWNYYTDEIIIPLLVNNTYLTKDNQLVTKKPTEEPFPEYDIAPIPVVPKKRAIPDIHLPSSLPIIHREVLRSAPSSSTMRGGMIHMDDLNRIVEILGMKHKKKKHKKSHPPELFGEGTSSHHDFLTRIKTLMGEMNAGNDNPSLSRELLMLIMNGLHRHWITETQYHDIIDSYNLNP